MLSVAKDQNGCRFLQRKFDEGGAAAIALVFPEVLDNLIELMVDPFGNYLIQKLLDRCSEEQRLQVSLGLPQTPNSIIFQTALNVKQHRIPNSVQSCKGDLKEGCVFMLNRGAGQ